MDTSESAGTPSDGTQVPLPTASEASTTAPAAPLREDQIQNAVQFLNHPRVTSSPVATKRSFLERKGLTAAEIDEAFKRVPAATAAATPSAPAASAPATSQQAMPANTQQYAPGTAQPPQYYSQQPQYPPGAMVPHQQQQLVPQQPEGYRWTQVVLGAGVLAAGLFLVKQYVVPYATQLYNGLAAQRRKDEEAQRKRDEALMEALQALQRSQDELRSSMAAVADMARSMKDSLAAGDSAPLSAADLRRELLSLSSSLAALGPRGAAGSSSSEAQELRSEVAELRGALKRMMMGAHSQQANGTAPVRPGSAGRPYSPANGSSYGGYNGYGGSRTVDTFPGESSMYSSHFAAGNGSSGYGDMYGQREEGAGARGGPAGRARGMGAAEDAGDRDEAPHSQAFYEVMEMVAKGITPPNVRTDIDDTPPDPTKPLPEPQLSARPKPWEIRNQQQGQAEVQARPLAYPSSVSNGNGVAAYGGDVPGPRATSPQRAGAALDPGAPEWTPAGGSGAAAARVPAAAGVAFDSLGAAGSSSSSQNGSAPEAAAAPAAPAAAKYTPPKTTSWRPPPPPMPTISAAAAAGKAAADAAAASDGAADAGVHKEPAAVAAGAPTVPPAPVEIVAEAPEAAAAGAGGGSDE